MISADENLIWLTAGPDTDCKTTRRNRAYAFNAGRIAYHQGQCFDGEEGVEQDVGRFTKTEAACFKAGYWSAAAGLPSIVVALYQSDD